MDIYNLGFFNHFIRSSLFVSCGTSASTSNASWREPEDVEVDPFITVSLSVLLFLLLTMVLFLVVVVLVVVNDVDTFILPFASLESSKLPSSLLSSTSIIS